MPTKNKKQYSLTNTVDNIIKKECLGTSGLSKHRRQDYNQEYQAIQKEKKRLKIS